MLITTELQKALRKVGLLGASRSQRQYPRFACCIPATMHIPERDYELEGLVIEISLGGALFRPAARYIMERTGSEIMVRFSSYKLAGRIMNTRDFGYGIRLNSLLRQDDIDMIIDEYGIQAPAV
jgi:hypothetical protein